MRKCSSAPQLAGQERQLHLARAGSRGLATKGGGGGNSAAGATSRLGTGSCNSLASLGHDDGGSPCKATLPGHSFSSDNLGRLDGGGGSDLGPQRNSGRVAGSPRSVRAASGTFGGAGSFGGGGRSASSGSLNSAAFSGGTLQRGASTMRPPPAAKRGPKPAQALVLDAPPAPPPQQQLPFEQLAEEAGEWMMEGASHGIASTDCFELFGFPEDAPNLVDSDSPGANQAKQAQERARRTAEAACLLTPATGQERDMGAQLHAAVRRAAVESEAQTQANYAEEIRRQAAESLLEEMDATLASPDKTSPRRKRRAEDEALDAEVLRIIVDDSAGDEPAAGATDHSPRTREALATMFAERQPSRNMLTIDEEDLPLASTDVAASIDLPASQQPLPAMDPPSSKQTGPEYGSHPAYQPPLVLVDNAAGSSKPSTCETSRDGDGGKLAPGHEGGISGSVASDVGQLRQGGHKGPGTDVGATSGSRDAGVPALASVRPGRASTLLAQAVGSANSASNAAPPAGGGASPGSAHPGVPSRPFAVPTSAAHRTTADKATQTTSDQLLSQLERQQPVGDGSKANGAGGCLEPADGRNGGRSKEDKEDGSAGIKGTSGLASSNAVPFIRTRCKAPSGQGGATGGA